MEEIEESESESSDDDEDMEPAAIAPGHPIPRIHPKVESQDQVMREDAPFPISAIATPDIIGTPAAPGMRMETEEGSDAGEEEDGLFAGGDDEEEESDGMEEVSTTAGEAANGVKRKLVEVEDYD